MQIQSPARCSSCRGVTFEIKSREGSLAKAKYGPASEEQKSSWWWSDSTSKVFPAASLQRSVTTPRSQFCYLDFETDEDDDQYVAKADDFLQQSNDEEKQIKPNHVHLFSASNREQPQQQPKPALKKNESRLSIILLDQGLFTVYKRLFVVCLALNATALVLAAKGHFPYARNRAALFSIANIFALVLCRSEAFLRAAFCLIVKVLGHSWVPLRLKTATTSFLQSLGGIHSSCGVSSVAWLVYALVLTLKDRDKTSPEIMGVASVILGLLFLSCFVAFPLIRHIHHNVFERTHRFVGWTALALLWAFIILIVSYDPETKFYRLNIGSILVKQKEFWFTVAITILIIIPWLTVRRVHVNVTTASRHASIIKFEGGVKAGILGRISPSPLSEWHAFGIISDGKKEHMMLVGAVGDFTKSLVSNPPTNLWVRQMHFVGLPYLVNMYSRALLVATGSGICVFLSFLLQPCSADVCVLWVAKGIEQNFGKEIKEMISGHPKSKVIVHDTAFLSRPNLSQMSIDAAKNWGAEVVIVTSNPKGSRDVVNACNGAGIPAFGPIWDS